MRDFELNGTNRKSILDKKIRKKKFIHNTLIMSIYVFPFVLLVGFLGLEIWAMVTYGDKPASEIPIWVLWLLLGGRGGR